MAGSELSGVAVQDKGTGKWTAVERKKAFSRWDVANPHMARGIRRLLIKKPSLGQEGSRDIESSQGVKHPRRDGSKD